MTRRIAPRRSVGAGGHRGRNRKHRPARCRKAGFPRPLMAATPWWSCPGRRPARTCCCRSSTVSMPATSHDGGDRPSANVAAALRLHPLRQPTPDAASTPITLRCRGRICGSGPAVSLRDALLTLAGTGPGSFRSMDVVRGGGLLQPSNRSRCHDPLPPDAIDLPQPACCRVARKRPGCCCQRGRGSSINVSLIPLGRGRARQCAGHRGRVASMAGLTETGSCLDAEPAPGAPARSADPGPSLDAIRRPWRNGFLPSREQRATRRGRPPDIVNLGQKRLGFRSKARLDGKPARTGNPPPHRPRRPPPAQAPAPPRRRTPFGCCGHRACAPVSASCRFATAGTPVRSRRSRAASGGKPRVAGSSNPSTA